MQLLKPRGALSFITSNKWYRSGYGKALRTYMRSHSKLMSIIDFGDEAVFTALAYPTIVIAQKRDMPLNPPPEADEVLALNWSKEQPVEQFPLVFAEEAFSVPQRELKIDSWQLEPPLRRQLLQRLRRAGTPLGEYCKGRFYYGIKTGLNEAFVIDGVRRAQLIADDPRSAEVIKPYLRGRDVKRWRATSEDLWLLYIPWHFPLHLDSSIVGASKDAERAFKSQYPAVYSHLKGFKAELTARNAAETGIRYEWYALQRWGADYWQEFVEPKIVLGRFMDKATYSFDADGRYPNNALSMIAGATPFLACVLNSSTSWWFLKSTCTDLQGGFIQAHNSNQAPIPVPSSSSAQRGLLDAIGQTLASGLLMSTTGRFEQLINGLVYELFFPDDLHAAGVRLFDACEREHITRLATLEGAALQTEAEALAERIFNNSHPIYAMLFDLQALDVVRIIEARD